MECKVRGPSRLSQHLLAAVVFGVLLVIAPLALGACGSAQQTSTGSNPGDVGTTISVPGLPEQMPSDFGFTAAYGVGARNVLDTFTGTFTKDIINPNKPNPTVELRLTPEELATLYQDLVDMDILDYPSVFRPELENQSGTMVVMTPNPTYLLTIRAAGSERSISWDDANQMTTPRAKALRDWFTKLQRLIEAKPEYQVMPPTEAGYQ